MRQISVGVIALTFLAAAYAPQDIQVTPAGRRTREAITDLTCKALKRRG